MTAAVPGPVVFGCDQDLVMLFHVMEYKVSTISFALIISVLMVLCLMLYGAEKEKSFEFSPTTDVFRLTIRHQNIFPSLCFVLTSLGIPTTTYQ